MKKDEKKTPTRKSAPRATSKPGTLTDAQQNALQAFLLKEAHDEKAGVEFSAAALGPDHALYAVATVSTKEDAGQYLLRLDNEGSSLALLHADTVIFPLPTPTSDKHRVPLEVQEALSEQLVLRLARARHMDVLDDDVPRHAEALRDGTAGLPLPGATRQRGFFDWIGGLFGDREPAPGAPSAPPSSEEELNRRLLRTAVAQVNVLSSREGPDGGNLACVWAVDRIFQIAFGRRLTRSVGTAVIDQELHGGTGRRIKPEDAKPGHIIISPTGTGSGHGHIGILGEDGKIYSNSSANARWEQNHTLASWKRRYVDQKGMALRFYQVLPSVAGLSVRSMGGASEPAASSAAPATRSLSTTVLPPVAASGTDRLARIDRFWDAQRGRNRNRTRAPKIPIVAEGDSWFDFKIEDDVIDWLEEDYDYDITNVARAGACLYEMAYGPDDTGFFRRDPSQLEELVRHIREKRPRAILLSGAGNDFVGPEFIMLIHHALSGRPGVNAAVVKGLFEQEIEPAYRVIIETANAATAREGLGALPILVHGYDFAFPDGRAALNLLIKKVGPWMGPSFELKGYPYRNEQDLERRRTMVRELIKAVYDMHGRLAASYPNLRLVDVRNLLTDRRAHWHDELHPNSDGFRMVARKFHEVLTQALGPDGGRGFSSGGGGGAGGGGGSSSSSSSVSSVGDTAPLSLADALGQEAGTPPPTAPAPTPAPAPAGGIDDGGPSPAAPTPLPEFDFRSESSSDLFARAREAQTRENIVQWAEVSPLRALEMYEEWQRLAADDTSGAAVRHSGPMSGLGFVIQDALHWHDAESIASERAREGGGGGSSFTLEALRAEYRELLDTCRIRPQHESTIAWYRQRIVAGRARYEALEAELNIPWKFIAITHSLEASNDFTKHLHNGDPLSARTVRVPRGRIPDIDPPYTFAQSARDAMRMKNYHLQTDWSEEAMLFRWEKYNGWGYRSRAINTPYLWSFSEHYTRGKFVADGVFDPNAVSRQAGAAVLLVSIHDV